MNPIPRTARLLCLALLGPAWALSQTPASVTYTYDDAGRLATGTFSDGKVVQYGYDPAGNRVSMNQGVPVQLSIAAANVAEGGIASFSVTKAGAALGTVTVDCVQTPGTAASGSDYTPSPQTLTFLVVDTSKTCSVQTVQDSTFEQNQTFSAVLQNVTGSAAIATGSAIGTISDNDPAPVFSVSGGSAIEGNAITFTISKGGSTELSHGLNYATTDGTAALGDSDYSAVSASYTFAPAETSITVNVPTTADGKFELGEILALNLSGASNGATIGTTTANGTISNDDAAPSFSINNPAAVNEGSLIAFSVTKGGNTNTGVTHSFSWATANGTAIAPADFVAASGTVDFALGDLTKQITVQTSTDSAVDGAASETFVVNLSTNANSNGGTLAVAQGTGTVNDVDNTIPGVPGAITITNVPSSNPSSTWPNFIVSWGASSGAPVNHYTLSESGTTFAISTGTSKTFTYNDSFQGSKTYQVRACGTATETQCSAYTTPPRTKLICPRTGCP